MSRKHRNSNSDGVYNRFNRHDPNPRARHILSYFDKVLKDKAISFFFTNFPDSWDFGALRKMFGRYGNVVDVYIAFKKAKRNTRFGFVRFLNIGDMDNFEQKLKGILIGNERLVINRAKFAREITWVSLIRSFPRYSQVVPQDPCPQSIQTGGLMLLFEWSSKEAASKSLEENGVWLQQCIAPVKSIAKVIGKILDVGRSYPVKIFEERFNASSLISPPTDHSSDDLMFEEEFVGPLMADGGWSWIIWSANFSNQNNRSYDFIPHLDPVPDLNAPTPRHGKDTLENDQELEDLLSSFQRISNMAKEAHSNKEKKRKLKIKKKKLVIPHSSPDLMLKNKLKRLKLEIKNWTSNRISAQNHQKEVLLKNLVDWELKAEEGSLASLDINKREEWLMDLEHLDQLHRDELKQKSRLRWAVEGDENTSPLFRRLSKAGACFLEAIITMDEVNEAVWSSSSDLKINLAESRLTGIGVDVEDVSVVSSSLGCAFDVLPFTYLGLLLGKRMWFYDGWVDVINRFRSRLSV
nr:nucleotide-binding alpha-beta plait domain-containing protein [Tanacetum cinerariifolium]